MTPVAFIEVLVEEPSTEQVLNIILPRIVHDLYFSIRTSAGKHNLMKNLPDRLRGYAAWLPELNGAVVVLIDRDDDDCLEVKARIEAASAPHNNVSSRGIGGLRVLNRIVIEELEAWFFGDAQALQLTYPWVPVSLGEQAKYRDPDAISGGTSEAFERLLKKYGYHAGGLPKTSAARLIAPHLTVEANTSKRFQVFRDGLLNRVGRPEGNR